jgi:hypothetical protein
MPCVGISLSAENAVTDIYVDVLWHRVHAEVIYAPLPLQLAAHFREFDL